MSAPAENLFPAGFDSEAAVSGAGWLDRRRADALTRFRAAGIPHRRIEEWKYSDLRNALESQSEAVPIPRLVGDPFAALPAPRLRITDGRLDSPVSNNVLPEGLEVLDLALLREDAPDARGFLEILNTQARPAG